MTNADMRRIAATACLRRKQPRVQELPRRAQRSHDAISDFETMPGHHRTGHRILP
jgi:hypothetical protein